MGYSSPVAGSMAVGGFPSAVTEAFPAASAWLCLPCFHAGFGAAPLLVQRLDAQEAGANAVEQVRVHGMRGRGEPVMRELPFTLRLDEPHAAQVREMTGNCGLGELEDLDDVADAQLARREHAQNANTSRVGKSLEHRVEISDGLGWKSRSHDAT